MEPQKNYINEIKENVQQHIEAILAKYQTTTVPPSDAPPIPSTLQNWKNEVLSHILWIVLLLNLPFITGDLIKSFQQHEYVLCTIIFAWIVSFTIITVVPKIGFGVRVSVLLFLFYFSATAWLIVNGLVGSGRIIFIALLVFAALFLDYRKAIMVWIGSLLTIAIVFATFAMGVFTISPTLYQKMYASTYLTIGWFVYTMSTVPIVISVMLVVNRLQHSIQHLQAFQATLEQQVQERTAILRYGIITALKELTLREKVEKDLRQSEARLNHLLQVSPVIIFSAQTDDEYATTFVSANVRHILGYEPQDVTAQPDFWSSLIHPDDAPTVLATIPRLFENGEYQYTRRFLHQDGTYRWMHNVLRLIYDAHGEPVEIVGSAEDVTKTKQAVEALRKSQALFKAIFDNAAVGIGLINTQGYWADMNQRGLEMLGYTLEELSQMTFLDVAHSEERATSQERFERLLRDSPVHIQAEKRCCCKDGSTIWVDLNATTLHDSNGKPEFIVEMLNDITERKHLQQALQTANTQLTEAYQTLVEHSLQGLTIFQNGCYVFANPTMKHITGYTVDELLAMSTEEIFALPHPDDQQMIQTYHQHRMQGKEAPNRYEHRIIHKDGSIHWVEAYISLTTYQGQLAAQAAYIDITERKQSELLLQSALNRLEQRVVERTEELRKSQALLQGMLNHSPAIIFVQDAQLRFLLVNQYALTQYGFAPNDIIGKTSHDVMPPHVATQWAHTHNQVWQARHHIEFEDIVEMDGQQRIFLSTKFPIFNNDNTIFAIGGIATDITERKQMEEALRQAKETAEQATRTKSEFLANMSHEIRTPMNAVIGMTNLLLDTNLTQEQHDYTETIRISGDTLLTIINDILDFSKIEAGKLELEQQPFNLRTCIEEAIELLAPRAAEKNVPLMYWIDADVPEHLIGDITRVRQIVVNLLSNAVKFTEHGEIVVSVDIRPGTGDGGTETEEERPLSPVPCQTIHIAVRDTGIGIPSDTMQRLFKSFSQADTSTTRKYGGTGLGLTIYLQTPRRDDGRHHMGRK